MVKFEESTPSSVRFQRQGAVFCGRSSHPAVYRASCKNASIQPQKSAWTPRRQYFVREISYFVQEIAHGLRLLTNPVLAPGSSDAKSYYTAMKQAYNSRSQALVVHRNIEACHD
jgi:hypothetical protein